ncbi:hypothetical protein BOTNAR_0332g00020 [Botryotinia narcissicola]|uniref:Uncharacterized protein n=1 Tax=Botryotinia narcissicola TaxID=278944 RepID=A0A4Z1HY68_9HELO|nr:hypothetical protein BOTNAR_0332g00020 [Botryotinia narcissicola]
MKNGEKETVTPWMISTLFDVMIRLSEGETPEAQIFRAIGKSIFVVTQASKNHMACKRSGNSSFQDLINGKLPNSQTGGISPANIDFKRAGDCGHRISNQELEWKRIIYTNKEQCLELVSHLSSTYPAKEMY